MVSVVSYQEVNMSFQYEPAVRLRVRERLLADELVSQLAVEFSISQSTLHRWKRQALIDVGRNWDQRASSQIRSPRRGARSR
jgi:transposase-like protein